MATPQTQMDRIVAGAVQSVQDRGQEAPVHHILLAGLDRQDQRAAGRHGTLVAAIRELSQAVRSRSADDTPAASPTQRQRATKVAAQGTMGAGVLAIVMYVLQQVGIVVG